MLAIYNKKISSEKNLSNVDKDTVSRGDND